MIKQGDLNSNADAGARKMLVGEILTRLDQSWTPHAWRPRKKPVDELVGTILSQNTSDTNTSRAFNALKAAFADWHAVAEANPDEVISAIRSGGLAQQKGPRIQNALRQVLTPGDPDPNKTLNAKLADMSPDDAMKWLTGFPGIGPKTAACVLLFSVGHPVVPVDTHVHRVSKRIGLIGPRTSADRAHMELIDIVPDHDSYRFHMHLIHHGRRTCRSRSPKCDGCDLVDICDYGRANAQQNAD
jgi:endonuclease III